MKSMNRVQLIGYLGKDPVVREYSNGKLFAKLRLATQIRLKNNEVQTTWHDVAIFGNEKVKALQNHFICGSHVFIEGSIGYKQYTNEKGATIQHTEIYAAHFMNLDR